MLDCHIKSIKLKFGEISEVWSSVKLKIRKKKCSAHNVAVWAAQLVEH